MSTSAEVQCDALTWQGHCVRSAGHLSAHRVGEFYWYEVPDPIGADPEEEVRRLRHLLASALGVARAIYAVHAEVGMDTAEDKALHARATETFRTIIDELDEQAGMVSQ